MVALAGIIECNDNDTPMCVRFLMVDAYYRHSDDWDFLDALSDSDVENYLISVYEFILWNEHGNEPSWDEMMESEDIDGLIYDIIGEYDDALTDCLTSYGEWDESNEYTGGILRTRRELHERYHTE